MTEAGTLGTVLGRWPEIVYSEECLREGMQIEDANIPLTDKLTLIDALAETGLTRIKIGSFVSPRYTPQMAEPDKIGPLLKLHPGVTYTATAAGKYREVALRFSPPLEILQASAALSFEMCDVFVR